VWLVRALGRLPKAVRLGCYRGGGAGEGTGKGVAGASSEGSSASTQVLTASCTPAACRFAFSIIWEVTPEGDISKQWVGRTVIQTAAKLAYQNAQDMIDGVFDASTAGVALHGSHSWDEVRGCGAGASCVVRRCCEGMCMAPDGMCMAPDGMCMAPDGICMAPDGMCMAPDGMCMAPDVVPWLRSPDIHWSMGWVHLAHTCSRRGSTCGI
jgi:hypothetical protein